MKTTKQDYPNPVLSPFSDDYIKTCSFNTIINNDKILVDDTSIVIPVSYSLVSEGIQSMIQAGEATPCILVQCSATSYSKLHFFNELSTDMKIEVPKYSVAKQIKLHGSIIAAKDKKDFENKEEFNELYFKGLSFEIRKGDILAIEDYKTIYVDDSELEKPLSSVFNISRRENELYEIEPEFELDKIEIYLNNPLFDLYNEFIKNGSVRYAMAIIVYPVLVEAIIRIMGHYQGNNSDNDEYNEKRWFRAIEHKGKKLGVSFDYYNVSPVSIANKMLGEISEDAMKSFKDTLDSEMNTGETISIGGID